MKNVIKFISILFLVLTMNQTTYAIKYTVTDIGTLGEAPSFGCGINDKGQVVGDSYITGGVNYHAFLWDKENGIIDLGTTAGNWSTAYKINNSGISAGSSTIQSDNINKHATIWGINNKTTNLGTLGGPWSSAYGINDSGKVVGLSYTDNTFNNSHAFIWDEINGISDLGLLGGTYSNAENINNQNQVVGYSTYTSENGNVHAFIWNEINGMTDIGTLGTNSYARGINDNNEVVGEIILANGISHAFIWNKNDGMRDIGTIENYSTNAMAINNFSQVVGYAWDKDSAYFGFIWDEEELKDLNTLLINPTDYVITIARDINNLGQISAEGYINGEHHAFLLTPVPEQTTLILLGVGLFGLIKKLIN